MKQFLLGLVLVVPIIARAQAPTTFIIQGTLGHINAPAKVYLLRMERVSFASPMFRTVITDSATLVNGKFKLKGIVEMPIEATLCLQRNGHRAEIFKGSVERRQLLLEPGPVVITGVDSLANASIKGTHLTAEYQKLTASLQPIFAQFTALDVAYKQASEAERKSKPFQQRNQEVATLLDLQKQQTIKAFIKANPSSWVSLHALQMLWPVPPYADLVAIYQPLAPALKSSSIGRQYGELLQKLQKVSVGEGAPDFSQKTPAGKLVSLTDYRGKYVLLEFWASWCGPCRAEIPNISKAYKLYKSRNFEVLSVSLDSERDQAKWLQAIKDDGTTWTQVSDLRGFESKAAKLYSISAIPQNFLLDPAGNIVAVNLRGTELQDVLARILK